MNRGHWWLGADLPLVWGWEGENSGRGRDWRATLKGLNRLLLLMNLFAWAQDWRASHLYPMYTRIRFIILPCFLLRMNAINQIILKTGASLCL